MTHDEQVVPLPLRTARGRSEPRRRLGLLSDTVWFTLLFGLTNVLSYVYLVVAGRQLAGTAFGVFNALLGMLTLAGVVASSVQTAVTAIAVHHPSRLALTSVNRRVVRLSLPVVIAITLVGLLLAQHVGADATQVVVCGWVTLALQLACPSVGFLLGMGMVWQQAAIGLLGTVARLAIGVPLMTATGGVVAGLVGYLVNHIVVLGTATALAWRHARPQESAPTDAAASSTSPLRVDRMTMATYIAVFLPFSLDQLIVQLVASRHGGSYAALGTMSKLVFFGAYPLIATAFPVIVRQGNVRAQLRVAGFALAGVVVIAGLSAAALALFPRQVLGLFFADRFAEAWPVLPKMAGGAFAFTASVLAAHLLIAWRSRWAPAASLAPFVAGAMLYAAHHGSLDVLVTNQVAIYGSQLALLAALVVVEGRRRR